MSCRRYFVDMRSMKEHFKTKVHKRRYGTIFHPCVLIYSPFLSDNYLPNFCPLELTSSSSSFSIQVEAAQRGAVHTGRGRESCRNGLLHPCKKSRSEDTECGRGHGLRAAYFNPRTDQHNKRSIYKTDNAYIIPCCHKC